MINARDLPLGQASAGLPNLNIAIVGWFQPLTFKLVCKAQIDGYTQEIENVVSTRGVRQPLKPYDLQIKPEGATPTVWTKGDRSPQPEATQSLIAHTARAHAPLRPIRTPT